MADLQHGIGEGVSGGVYSAGSLPYALLHGAVGCAAAEALDGNCASGAAAGIAQSVFAGLQEGAPTQQPGQSDEDYAAVYDAWKNDVAGQAKLLGAVVGYTTSGGLAVNVTNAASIAESGARHNYLSHAEAAGLEHAREALALCDTDGGCSEETREQRATTIAYLEELDQQRDLTLRAVCEDDPYGLACTALVTDALIAVEYYRDPTTGIGYPVLPGYALLETYLRHGMDGHPREGFVEDVYQHREDAIALLEEFSPSVAHTQQQLADGNGIAVLAVLSGGGIVALAPRVAAACLTNPTCRAGAAGFEVAGSVTDMAACANGDGLACGAALVPVVTTGGLGDDLVDLGSDARRGDGVLPNSTLADADDLAEIRARYGLSDANTVGAARTDIPGLEGVTFEGISPTLRNDAELPSLDELYGVDRPIQSPRTNDLFTRHAEEDIFNGLVREIDKSGLTASQLNGRTVSIHISNQTGVCTACYQGLTNPNVPAGVVKQFSERYPGVTIRITSEGGVARPGVQELVVRGGAIVE